ncbi:MAG: hypothetical protein IT384_03470 [Deltaproteobacteria bacterium]|nr:hypothetical protein [Deltaproteobacteria bacterium]
MNLALPLLKDTARRIRAGREWFEEDSDSPQEMDQFSRRAEAFYQAACEANPEVAEASGLDFWNSFDSWINDLPGGWQDGAIGPTQAKALTRTIRSSARREVGDWLAVVPVSNLDFGKLPGDRRTRPHLERFRLLPRLAEIGTSQDRVRRFQRTLRAYAVRQATKDYRFDLDMFEHHELKWAGGLSGYPQLWFRLRGTRSSAARGVTRCIEALRIGLEAADVPYTRSPKRSYARFPFSLAPKPPPYAGWCLLFSTRSGWFDRRPTPVLRLPPWGLTVRAGLRRRIEHIVSTLIDGHRDDRLARALLRSGRYILQASETRDQPLRLVLLVMAVETLVGGSSDGITRNFSNVSATLIARRHNQFVELRKMAQEIYKVRSLIVHGQSYPALNRDEGDQSSGPAEDANIVRRAEWTAKSVFLEVARAHQFLVRARCPPAQYSARFAAALSRMAFDGAAGLEWRRGRDRAGLRGDFPPQKSRVSKDEASHASRR